MEPLPQEMTAAQLIELLSKVPGDSIVTVWAGQSGCASLKVEEPDGTGTYILEDC